MKANDFWLLGDDGAPETYIDAESMTAHAARIVERLLAAIDDPEAVADAISREVMALDAPDTVRLILAAVVIDHLVSGTLAPLLEASNRLLGARLALASNNTTKEQAHDHS